MTVYPNPVSPRDSGTPDPQPPTVDPMVDRPDRETELRERALRQLKKKADFRTHLLIYVLVNAMIVVIWAFTGAGFFWPIIPLAGWGVGVVANAMDVYRNMEPTEEDIASEMERLRNR